MDLNELKQKFSAIEKDVDELLTNEKLTDEQNNEVLDKQKELVDLKKEITKAEKAEQVQALKIARGASGNNGVEEVDSEEKEMAKMGEKFMITKAMAAKRQNKELDGVEAEFFKEAQKEVSSFGGELTGNVAIPSKYIKIGAQKDLTIGTEGTDVRPLDLRGVIPILAPNPVVSQLGAQSLTGLVGDVQFPRHNGAATLAWEGETDANAETTPTFDKVTMAPNRLGGYIDVSQTFMRQVNWSAEQWTRGELNRVLGLKLDQAAINGSGSGNEPTGILNLASLNAVTIATDGGAPTYAKTLEMIRAVEEDDALEGTLAWLGNPKVRYKLSTTPKQGSGVEGNFIMDKKDELVGYRYGSSTQVPSNLTKGSGTNLSALIFGNFNSLMIGQWGGVDLLVDPFTQATNGLVRVVINGYFDIAAQHDEHFVAVQELVTT